VAPVDVDAHCAGAAAPAGVGRGARLGRPQGGVDPLAVTRWKNDNPELVPIYEWLGLFNVYSSPWFAAIYLLLVISLVGCILPRTAHYWRVLRAQPPAAPAKLARMPTSTSYRTDADVEAALAHARKVLGRRHRLRRLDTSSADEPDHAASRGYVSAERGHLREAGNLLFHLSVLVVLAGFAWGAVFGYQGGVILVKGSTFANNLTQYDDFDPGSLFTPEQLDDFAFTVEEFNVEWLREGPQTGMARGFQADLSWYADGQRDDRDEYLLRVNHPLTIGSTDIFLIGHGYAPVITVRDGEGEIAYAGPTIFLPQDASFLSFGVVKATAAQPRPIGLEGLFYPTYINVEGDPATLAGEALNPVVSMLAYTGDFGLDDGTPQSVYLLNKANADQVLDDDGSPVRVDLNYGETYELPQGLGTVEFSGVEPWVRVQISQSPGKEVALLGVILALIGLCGSLFIRPRRVFVRARRTDGGGGESTLVEVAVLDRTGNADVEEILKDLLEALQEENEQR
jgi:cytochrome c biogenesis protein